MIWCLLRAAPVLAAATLTVDLSTTYRPVTHVGIGSLYGVIEKVPADADLQRLVGELHPRMFTNPASSDPGTQQPGVPANAIKVATRLAPFGATVTIRLADWFSGWYAFTTMTDWLDKVGTTIAAKKAANLSNVYAYEIWNEPNGSWTNGGDANAIPGGAKSLSFNALWKQTYDRIRQLDPGVKITGPSISYMDPDFMNSFLTYCKTNNCLPDVIGWHEGTNIEGDVTNYRNLEKQLGVGPLPITINEYSGSGRAKDEGRPGAAAPLIAQMERAGVDTASSSWWTPDSIAGHLGSLLATDSQTNGGWFLYKWYGDMTGSMVMTTPSLPKDGKNLDGIASLDVNARNACVVVGGVSDGTVQVVIKGFKSTAFFGGRVRAVVDHTRWTGRGGVATGTDTLSDEDLTIANDQVTVSISTVNGDDGYRVSLTEVGAVIDAGGGGDAGSGGDSRARDATEAGGGEAGGPSGSGGQTGAGGRAGVDAAADAGAGRGGSIGSGGSTSLGSGGSTTSSTTDGGGTMGAGGTSTGGDASGGGAGTAGALGGATGGTGGSAGNPGAGSGGSSGTSTKQTPESSGCSCAMPGRRRTGLGAMWILLGLLLVRARSGGRARGGRRGAYLSRKSQSDPSSRESPPLPSAPNLPRLAYVGHQRLLRVASQRHAYHSLHKSRSSDSLVCPIHGDIEP
jgi:hypothetical protein